MIPVLSLPIAVLLAFIPMVAQGLNANIMSLGGIAIAIGAMVDASIIMVENVHKRARSVAGGGERGAREAVILQALPRGGTSGVLRAARDHGVVPARVHARGHRGPAVPPLAFTKTYSMAFAALLAITLTPALAMWLDPRPHPPGARAADRARDRQRVHARARVRGAAAALGRARRAADRAVDDPGAALALGTEFMPPLNEGTLLYMPTAPPGMSDTESATVLQSMARALKQVPEVKTVFGKIGRARTATDPAPPGMAETVITLKPESEWRPGMTWDKLVAELDRKLHYPGMPNLWWFPIQTRNEMLSTGVRSAAAVKIYGPDLGEIERLSVDVERALRGVRGARSVFAERLTGGLFLDFDIRRDEAARYGLTVGDVQDVIEAAIGGLPVAQTVEGRERYGIAVRYARELRDDPDRLERVLVPTPAGAQVPLGQVATLSFRTGPADGAERGRAALRAGLDRRCRTDQLGEFVRDAQTKVAREVTLPPGYRLAWAGQFEYLERAQARLAWVVPLTLLLVALLLFLNLRSVTETVIVLLAVPFSLVGAVWLLWLLHYNLSVAVWVGHDRARRARRRDRQCSCCSTLNIAHRERVARGALARPSRPARGHRRGRRASHPPQTHDRARDPVRPAADPVGPRQRRRRDEADCRADAGWRDQLVRARAAGVPRDFRVVEGPNVAGDGRRFRGGRGRAARVGVMTRGWRFEMKSWGGAPSS